MAHKTLLLALGTITLSSFVVGNPPKVRETDVGQSAYGNLKFTFDNPADIPSAFFDEPERKTRRDAPEAGKTGRKIYPGCSDGSGGMCVGAGECPADKRPQNSNPAACKPNQECCYGVPLSDTSCSSRGGECMAISNCGNAPRVAETECSGVNGQVCCVLL